MISFLKRRKKYISEIPSKVKSSFNYKVRKTLYPYINYEVSVEGDLGEKYCISEKNIDDKVLSGLLDLYYGLYFPEEIRKEDVKVVWDLGAHHGYYTLRSLFEYPSAKVIAIEPNPDSVNQIKKNISNNNINSRVSVLNSALSDNNEDITLLLSDKGSWGDSLYLEDKDASSGVKVETVTFSDLLSVGMPDVIKCNAEGAEYILVDELEKHNVRPSAIILMVHPEFGNPEELLKNKLFDDYTKSDKYSTKKRLRYLYLKKNANRN